MKGLYLLLLAFAAFAASAKQMTITITTDTPPRPSYPYGVPFVGYAADPQPGDESAVLACRRAGAWIFRTAKCDDETLAFCSRYGLRLFLVVDGERKDIVSNLTRIAKGPYAKAVAAIQLGADPSGGKDPLMWRNLAVLAAKKLPGVSIAVPVRDLDSPLYAKMWGYLNPVTHLVVDLRDTPAPYKRLERIAEKLRNSPDKSISKLRLWAVGPGRLKGTPDDRISTPAAVAWQMHWIMSALASDHTAGVFVERPYRADDFGLALRHLWVSTTMCRSLVGHGEGATCATFAPKPQRAAESDLMLEDESLDTIELNDKHSAGPPPVACAKVAKGEKGDVEYLVFFGDYNLKSEEDGKRVSVFLVNTTGERVEAVLDVNRHGGHGSSGFRRRLVPDEKTGQMRNSTRERQSRPIKETVEPGEVTFFDFRI